MDFRWNAWNLEHVTQHGVAPEEAEWVVRTARRPWPERREDNKWLVIGPGTGGRFLQVVFVREEDDVVYVIHARPMNDREKHRYRKRRR